MSSPKISAAGRPFLEMVAAMYSPLEVVIFSIEPTSTPAFFANACAAGVGAPSLKAILVEGPVSRSCTSGCDSRSDFATTASRRGVEYDSTVAASARRSRCTRSPTRFASSSRAVSIIRAGISSVPISSRKSAIPSLHSQFIRPSPYVSLITTISPIRGAISVGAPPSWLQPQGG